jgi:hypothetical protein
MQGSLDRAKPAAKTAPAVWFAAILDLPATAVTAQTNDQSARFSSLIHRNLLLETRPGNGPALRHCLPRRPRRTPASGGPDQSSLDIRPVYPH